MIEEFPPQLFVPSLNSTNMPSVRKQIVDMLISRSFATKTTILVIGTGVILLGTELRPTYPVIGTLVLLAGLMTDWGIVYIVYIEITRIRDEIGDTQSRVEMTRIGVDETKSEVDETHREIKATKNEISDMHERVFDMASDSKTRSTNLESRVKELEQAVGTGRSSSGISTRLDKIEEELKDLKYKVTGRRF